MLNISIYLSQPVERNIAYIKKMSDLGIKTVFTSLQIPEENGVYSIGVIKKIASICKARSVKFIADISPDTLRKFNVNEGDEVKFFNDLGIDGVRIDYGFKAKEIKEFSKTLVIVLNASTITEGSITEFNKVRLDITNINVMHNFYPREETGLDRNFFIEKNRWLNSHGFQVSAFIPGDGTLRGPVYCGLPTLEEHRNKSPFVSYLDLIKNCGVHQVFIGDLDVSENTYRHFKEFILNNKILLNSELFSNEENDVKRMDIEHVNRKDLARDCIRSAKSRVIQDVKDEIHPKNTIERKKGSITIDNIRYGRYMGEIQITKTDLLSDDRVNVLGKVVDEDIDLIRFIEAGSGFKFQFINKK